MNWANFVPAIGSLLGSVGQGLFSSHSASKAFERQKELWTFMQSNAHQLEVEDLKKAGLNPILSATNSQLAGMPSVGQERTPDNDIGMALTSALQVGLQKRGLDQNYELELRKLGLRDKELKIQEQQSAANIANLEAQRDEVLEKIKGISIENRWKDRLHEADVRNREALTRKFFAEADKAVNESSLVDLQKEKLSSQLKYGEIFCRYLPPRLADQVIDKLDDIIGRSDFEKLFIDKVADGADLKSIVKEYADILLKNKVISYSGGD